MSADRKLEWLEAMRGFAALWVLIHHAGQTTDHFVGTTGGMPWIDRGYLGVDFFFVLSGFIIAYASQRLAERGGGVKDYLSARLVRIYVPYLPVGIGMFLLYQLLPSLSEGGRDPGLMTSLTLLPSNEPPALSVAWTLVHEMIFYAVYVLWFLHRWIFRFTLGLWVLMILVVAAAGADVPRAGVYFVSPLNLYFLAGIGIFHASRKVALGVVTTALLALVGIVVLVVQVHSTELSRIAVGVSFVAMVFAALSPLAAGFRVWRPLLGLGAASYAIYLVHNPVLSIAVRGVNTLTPNVNVWIAFGVISLASAVAGLVYWRAYERPMLGIVRAWLGRNGTLTPVRTGA